MAKEVCVFCGTEVGYMRSEYVSCGPVSQWACKSCAKEVKDLDEVERCRQALRLSLAVAPDALQEYVTMVEGAEDARPTCLRCGTKLKFGQVVTLDSSPYRDGLLSNTFDILPAYCRQCGKMELYNPGYSSGNKLLSYLVKKDTGELK